MEIGLLTDRRPAVAGGYLPLRNGSLEQISVNRMTAPVRISIALALSLLVGLTGQGLANSRGMSAAVAQMEICTGTGPVILYMDAKGQPTAPPHYCPDFALMLLGALLPDAAAAPVPPQQALPVPDRTQPSLIARILSAVPARAPPALI
ncbi:hypothetical protein KBY23_13390 [Ruegeria pomeroyi]|nr:hypothetical protein [Ruegeria pomeroyi]